jgi:superfamily II DNA/RNA helicase
MSAKKKKSLINNFEQKEKAVLTSCRVLNEGVNIPIVDSVCFVDGRNNSIDIIQCIGRALRLYKGKETAKIIIPILEENVVGGNFNEIVKIIKNLSNYDYHVKESIMNKKGDKKIIRFKNYNDDSKGINLDLKDLENKICSVIVDKCYGWDKNCERLIEFFETNKKRPSSISKNADEKQLGYWIGTQKKNYAKQKDAMKDETKRKRWEEVCEKYKEYMMDNDEIWDTNCNNLINYFETNKKRPSCSSKDADEKQLGTWIGTQKNNYAKQEKSMKDETKRKRWEEVCEKYKEYMMDNDEIWNTNCNNLINYFETNKKRPSCSSKDADEKQLGSWIQTQMQNYIKQEQTMKDETKRKRWEEVCEKYKEYLK